MMESSRDMESLSFGRVWETMGQWRLMLMEGPAAV